MNILEFTLLVSAGSFCAGLLGALTGLGGGVVLVPLLTFFASPGNPPFSTRSGLTPTRQCAAIRKPVQWLDVIVTASRGATTLVVTSWVCTSPESLRTIARVVKLPACRGLSRAVWVQPPAE